MSVSMYFKLQLEKLQPLTIQSAENMVMAKKTSGHLTEVELKEFHEMLQRKVENKAGGLYYLLQTVGGTQSVEMKKIWSDELEDFNIHFDFERMSTDTFPVFTRK